MTDLFRADAVRKLRDPQDLDAAVRLTSPAGWLLLGSIAAIFAAVVAWGFLGVLPFQVQGLGIILRGESSIYTLSAIQTATVKSIEVRVGDEVKPGQTVVVLHQPDLQARIQGAQRKLDALLADRQRRTVAVDSDIAARQRNLDDQVSALNSKRKDSEERIRYLRNLLAEKQEELRRQFITRESLEQTRDALFEEQQDLVDSELQIAKLRTEQSEYAATRRQSLDEFDEEVLEAQNQLDLLRAESQEDTQVQASQGGIVTSIDVRIGEILDAGSQVAVIEETGKGLTVYGYFPVSKGKQIEKRMQAMVTPTTVERDIYGSVIGHVIDVSRLAQDRPDLQARLGDEDLVTQMMASGSPIEVVIELQEDPNEDSGLAWSGSSGPPIPITPGTTAAISVTVRQTRPVDLIVPIFETWVLGGG